MRYDGHLLYQLPSHIKIHVRMHVFHHVPLPPRISQVWYDAFRRVYKPSLDGSAPGFQITKTLSREQIQKYRDQARFCVQSPRGPCSFDGWVYTSKLHMPEYPQQPFRRLVLDEIQDLIEDGTEAQKNLVQLSRQCGNVWLLSATPFPHGNRSVKANHELLGFKRLKLDVENAGRLGAWHPFEKIKAKLYVRSPQSVADEAVEATASVTKQTINIDPRPVEKTFYNIAYGKAMQLATNPRNGEWDQSYFSCRQMTVHPEASADLRQQLASNRNSTSSAFGSSSSSSSVNRVGRYASVDSFARQSLNAARSRLRELQSSTCIPRQLEEVRYTSKSLQLAEKVKAHRASAPRAANPFAATGNADASDFSAMEREAEMIHDFFCTCCRSEGPYSCSRADRNAVIRLIRERNTFGHAIGPEFIKGDCNAAIEHFATGYCRAGATMNDDAGRNLWALDHYISVTRRTLDAKKKALEDMEKEAADLEVQIEALAKSTAESREARAKARGNDNIAAAHGSKSAALIQYFEEHDVKDRHIVFSMWHDTLRLVQLTLQRNGIDCVFCHGSNDNMQSAIDKFTSGKVNVILLSARAKASGANLQAASHVIFLDPPGEHADHGATLERQAIGRAVRIGQKKPVTVIRFSVEGTLEAKLWGQIDDASARISKRDDDLSYTITEGKDQTLARQVTIETADDVQAHEEEEDDGIEMGETTTEEDRIKQRMEEARKNGTEINLTLADDGDDDDEQTDESVSPPSKRAKTSHVTPKVKSEGAARVSPDGPEQQQDSRSAQEPEIIVIE